MSSVPESTLRAQLPHCLKETHFVGLGDRYQGKVRDTYAAKDRLYLVTTDRLSAFDHVLTTVPFKGELLNRLATFWFRKTAHVVPNHLLDVPHPNVAVARKCSPFPVEMVVRGYLTGSLWRDYQKGERSSYGVQLPPGLTKDERFETPLLTPTTKAEYGAHDAPISPEEIVARGLMSQRDFERAREAVLGLFAEGQAWARSRGLILVDTKYELGTVGDALYVIDEMHTPDSSRYWKAAEYEARRARSEDQAMLDKENVRQWLIRERGFQGQGTPPTIPDDVRIEVAKTYLAAYEQITGEALALWPGNVEVSMLQALARFGLPPS